MAQIPDWINYVRRWIANPRLVMTSALDQVESYYEGRINISSPSSPFIALLEAGAVNASALHLEQEAILRRQYPSMAVTQEDLYLHMSDADYSNRFAQPAAATFTLMLGRDEIYQRAVEEGSAGVRKMTIPRHTRITVGDVAFTMQYPIDIRIMPHGGLSVTYDNSKISPLQALSTNVVKSSIIQFQDTMFLRLDIPILQFAIDTQQFSTNLTQLVDSTFTFTNQFHYARVYLADSQGNWSEIKTTHTDQVFDPTEVTAVLKVDGQRLNIKIPQIYNTLAMVGTELRVDIYTTQGPMEMVLSDYKAGQFVANWKDRDRVGDDPYADVLNKFNTYTLFSDDTVVGGRNSLSLEALRDRVITNSLGKINVPITAVNLGSRLSDLGYDMVLDVDNITDRQYLATRSLPEPKDGSTISGAGCTMMTLTDSMENLVEHETVYDNGERITILPTTLFQNLNGLLNIVPKPLIDALNAMPVDVRARRINEANYLYTPFHYVLDMGESHFEHRAYFLETPYVETKSFVAQNPTAVMSVAVKSYQIDRVAEGYLVTLTLQSGKTWKDLSDDQVFCQMAYTPFGEQYRAYQNGTLQGVTEQGERVYTFLIGTNYDVDRNDNLIVNTFQMFDDPVHTYPCPLDTDFDVFFAVNQIEIEGFELSTIDQDMGKSILPNDALGITHERLTIHLGDSLDGLWASSRSVASATDYRRYMADVPAVYKADVYERDPVSGAIVYDIINGEVVFRVLHRKGDPVLDDQGNPVIEFYEGDVMLDVDNQPIVVSSRKMLRQIDLFMVDGIYWFVTDPQTITYKTEIPSTIVGWLRNDIATVQEQLLEKTNLYFYPKSTLGNADVKVLEDKQVSINSAQSFSVTYYLSGTAYRDAALRTALTNSAISTIHDALQEPVVTRDQITSALRDKVSGDAISVSVTGLGGATPYETITMVDHSARLSIRKKAVAKADGTVGVEDDVSIAFIRHTET